MTDYIVAGTKTWNHKVFEEQIKHYNGNWHFAATPDELNKVLSTVEPRYIFFLHWSHKVPETLINHFECVCFHMTDVPYGRGGSPLQNLIVRGHRNTKLTALQMVADFDAGPVYLKKELSLEGSSAEEIYIRATYLSADIIQYIIDNQPIPTEQEGEVTVFRRRKPSESHLHDANSLIEIYDFIRMLDAEDYPKAFIELNGFRLEFSRATLYDGCIKADVCITKMGEENQ